MSTKYGIRATEEHHTCMVISFGQAGCFDKAMMVIKSVPCLDDPSSLWLALLGTCAKWGNVNLARLSFDHVMQTNPELASAYVVMANIYAAAGMREEAEEVENMQVKHAMPSDEQGASF
jgi:thioredoxin-like negative regulator of GroEL